MSSDSRKKKAPDPKALGRTREPVARFQVFARGFVGSDGKAKGALPAFAENDDALIALYEAMVRTRAFDEKAIALQRTGRLGTYASSLGQEAVGVGVAAAMTPEDVLLPSFREHAAQLWRGVTPLELFLYWGGDERGSAFAGPRGDFPVSIPVASHYPHAAGAALAFKCRSEACVSVAMGGDGSTSKGDFYEALNVCGAWKLPAVFVVSNNQWAISVPRGAQTAAQTLAQKAVAAGVPGEQVDGNDVIAVRHTVHLALERARAGDGPTLIEALTYRLGDHTTADDASRYRNDAEVSPHWAEDPITRLRTFLASRKAWDKTREEALLQDCKQSVEDASQAFLEMGPEPPQALFDHLYAELPAALAAEYTELVEREQGDA